MSSWEEYLGVKKESFCHKEIILDQFKDIKFYKNFAEDSIRDSAECVTGLRGFVREFVQGISGASSACRTAQAFRRAKRDCVSKGFLDSKIPR
jgi:hypothetical protein